MHLRAAHTSPLLPIVHLLPPASTHTQQTKITPQVYHLRKKGPDNTSDLPPEEERTKKLHLSMVGAVKGEITVKMFSLAIAEVLLPILFPKLLHHNSLPAFTLIPLLLIFFPPKYQRHTYCKSYLVGSIKY